MTASVDDGPIVVVGAGPHALTFCSYLLTVRPDWHSRLVVIDPDGWLSRWDAHMARLEIDVLRSPGVHHPDPAPYALFEFAAQRTCQLRGDYKSPTVELFSDFCRHLIHRHHLDQSLREGMVTSIVPDAPGRNRVQVADGTTYDAAVVVIAANRTVPRIPAWAAGALPGSAISHAATANPSDVQADDRVVVVGGGLTAAQLCLAALRRQAAVVLVARHELRCSNTDTDPGWLSQYRLGPFLAEPDWEQRARVYRSARAGTMPSAWADQLRRAAAQAQLALHENAAVTAVTADRVGVTVHTSSKVMCAQRVWLATGWEPDTRPDPLFGPLVGDHTTRCGLPILDHACRIADTTVHLTGAAAALQVGALAPNLAGARIAAERIVASLTDLPDRQYPVPPAEAQAAPGSRR